MLDEYDFITQKDDFISIISSSKEKEKLGFNNKFKIISLIKIEKDEICLSSSDKSLNILKFSKNNTKFEIKFELKNDYNMYNLIYHHGNTKNDDSIIFIRYKNNESNIFQIDSKRNIILLAEENEKIIIMKELSNNHIIYLTEKDDDNNFNNTDSNFDRNNNDDKIFVNFINLINKEKSTLEIEKESKFCNLAIIKDYCAIGFELNIILIDFIKKTKIRRFNLENRLTNLIRFNDDELILALYNVEKKISIIREIYIKN